VFDEANTLWDCGSGILPSSAWQHWCAAQNAASRAAAEKFGAGHQCPCTSVNFKGRPPRRLKKGSRGGCETRMTVLLFVARKLAGLPWGIDHAAGRTRRWRLNDWLGGRR